MRILLALAILVAVVVLLLLVLPSRSAPAVVEPIAVATAAPSPHSVLDGPTAESRADPRQSTILEAASRDAVAAEAPPSCRVEIVLVADEPVAGWPDVTCSDAVGRPIICTATGAKTFVAPEVAPGEYHLAVNAHDGWNRAGTRFVIGPGERAKRVEIQLHVQSVLRVRWQSMDSEPIVSALSEPDVLAGSAVLRVSASPLGTHADTPAAGGVPSLTRNVSPQDAGRFPNLRDPPWLDAPPDAFGVLRLPGEPPCTVNACIGGLVVDSIDVRPGTTEVLFRTDVDTVRAWRTALRFRVVAAESGTPLTDAHCMVSSRNGFGTDWIQVGPEGRAEETYLLPGTWVLTIQGEQRAPHVREFSLGLDTELDLGTIALVQHCSVSGTLLLPDGSPAADILTQLRSVDRFEGGDEDRRLPTTQDVDQPSSQDGRVSWPLTDERLVILVADDRWAALPLLVEPCSGERARAEFTLRLVEGVPIALDFGPTSPFTPEILVSTAEGLPVARRQIGLSGLVSLRLAPGEYQVVRPGLFHDTQAFSVGSESAVIEVR